MSDLRSPSLETIRAASALVLAGLVLIMVPLIAAIVAFTMVRGLDRHRVETIGFRATIAPEAGLARLGQPEERP